MSYYYGSYAGGMYVNLYFVLENNKLEESFKFMLVVKEMNSGNSIARQAAYQPKGIYIVLFTVPLRN